jgi:ketosteroid isomerase-like protein
MKTAAFLLAAAALSLTACQPAADKEDGASVDKAAIEQAIRDKETGWMEAYNKRDAAALQAEYEDEAAVAGFGAPLASDAAARKTMLEAFAADPALKVDFASDRIIVADSGDLASSRGHYSITSTDPSTKKPKTETGSYLTVYRKAADGSWKAVEDFTTPGPAADAAAATTAPAENGSANAADNASSNTTQ